MPSTPGSQSKKPWKSGLKGWYVLLSRINKNLVLRILCVLIDTWLLVMSLSASWSIVSTNRWICGEKSKETFRGTGGGGGMLSDKGGQKHSICNMWWFYQLFSSPSLVHTTDGLLNFAEQDSAPSHDWWCVQSRRHYVSGPVRFELLTWSPQSRAA